MSHRICAIPSTARSVRPACCTTSCSRRTREITMPCMARLTDMHTCPMVTGVVPHVGGPIVGPGAPKVLVGGLPAACVGDLVTCVGPPDTIVVGFPKVLVCGKPAAMMGSVTAHGGVVVLGCPTVQLG